MDAQMCLAFMFGLSDLLANDIGHPRRGRKPEFKLRRYPPLDEPTCCASWLFCGADCTDSRERSARYFTYSLLDLRACKTCKINRTTEIPKTTISAMGRSRKYFNVAPTPHQSPTITISSGINAIPALGSRPFSMCIRFALFTAAGIPAKRIAAAQIKAVTKRSIFSTTSKSTQPYQRGRATITRFRLELRKSM